MSDPTYTAEYTIRTGDIEQTVRTEFDPETLSPEDVGRILSEMLAGIDDDPDDDSDESPPDDRPTQRESLNHAR